MGTRLATFLGSLLLSLSGVLLASDGAIPIWQATTIGPGQEGKYVLVRNISNGGLITIHIQDVTGSVDIDLNGFTVYGDGIAAQNVGALSVRNGTLADGDYAVSCSNCGTVVVHDVRFRNNEAGTSITLSQPKQFDIRRNTFYMFGGIVVSGAAGGTIEDNTVTQWPRIEVENSSNVQVRNNNLRGASYYLSVDGVACVVAGNTLSGGTYLRSTSCDSCLFVDNTITGSPTAGNAMYFGNLRNSTVRGNTVSASDGVGILVQSGSANLLFDNVVSQSAGVGLLIDAGWNQIERNVLNSNTGFGLRINGSGNVYRGNTARGNGGTGCPAGGATSDFCDAGTGNTSHVDNYMPGKM